MWRREKNSWIKLTLIHYLFNHLSCQCEKIMKVSRRRRRRMRWDDSSCLLNCLRLLSSNLLFKTSWLATNASWSPRDDEDTDCEETIDCQEERRDTEKNDKREESDSTWNIFVSHLYCTMEGKWLPRLSCLEMSWMQQVDEKRGDRRELNVSQNLDEIKFYPCYPASSGLSLSCKSSWGWIDWHSFLQSFRHLVSWSLSWGGGKSLIPSTSRVIISAIKNYHHHKTFSLISHSVRRFRRYSSKGR